MENYTNKLAIITGLVFMTIPLALWGLPQIFKKIEKSETNTEEQKCVEEAMRQIIYYKYDESYIPKMMKWCKDGKLESLK